MSPTPGSQGRPSSTPLRFDAVRADGERLAELDPHPNHPGPLAFVPRADIRALEVAPAFGDGTVDRTPAP